jgi:hypothetical protein
VPSVPTKIALKWDPPMMTLAYHFERNETELYYHEIPIDPKMLQSKSADDVVSHLYVTEAYYFNPKQIKRPQVLRLVRMMQNNSPKQLKRNER